MKARGLVRVRRISQASFLLIFFFLLVQARLPQDVYLDYSLALSQEQDLRLHEPVTFFFRLDPLVGFTSLLSGHKWIKGLWWGLGVLLLTLFLGRVFCGFVCPFGTIHHIVGWLKPALKGPRMIQANQRAPSQRIKYFVLFTLLIAASLGLNMSGLMDPISFLFRSVAVAILPGLGIGLKAFFDTLARSDVKILSLLSYGGEVLVSPVFGYDYKAFHTGWLIGCLFLLTLFLNRLRPRFWCRALCPLGALLGIFSKFSLLKLKKAPEKCTNCHSCTSGCQGAASPAPGKEWESAECMMCFNCFDRCTEGAINFELAWSLKANKGPDTGRRAVLAGLAAGISLPFLGRLDGRIYRVSDPRLIRPPGSLPEKEFLTLCQRCGLCMRVCPTNVINPTLSEAGMGGFWTPHLIMTQGYCEYTCTLCGSVCPTGAIEEIKAREKIERPVRIGSAYVDRGRCLPWSGNGPCIVCEEHCPTSPKAIYLRESVLIGPEKRKMKLQLPHVDLRRCVGCGICEYKCPVKGKAAIRVIAAGESRSIRNQILLPS